MAVMEGIDPGDLGQTGWGVIFAQNTPPAVREALSELLQHRRQQASRQREDYYCEYAGGQQGYAEGESSIEFLTRHGVTPGPADPTKMPYYILIVGDPEAIPFRTQIHMDVQYAVGRIHFETLEEYANYARSVVRAETSAAEVKRQAVIFGVENPDDVATTHIIKALIEPLCENLPKIKSKIKVRAILEKNATKANLRKVLHRDRPPALLFTACHGLSFPYNHASQRAAQGSLVCGDWPGPKKWKESLPPEFYFTANDVSESASLLGLIAFLFGSYSAGTSRTDDFAMKSFRQQAVVAPQSFISALPQRLLGHPNGGALAVIGHVDRIWGGALDNESPEQDSEPYSHVLKRLIEGVPVGLAAERFNEHHAELATALSAELEGLSFGKLLDDRVLAHKWMCLNDVRNHIILGDPAVRIPLSQT
jgi:hypothetical protein